MATTPRPPLGYHEQTTNSLIFIGVMLKQTNRVMPVDLKMELNFRGVNPDNL